MREQVIVTMFARESWSFESSPHPLIVNIAHPGTRQSPEPGERGEEERDVRDVLARGHDESFSTSRTPSNLGRGG